MDIGSFRNQIDNRALSQINFHHAIPDGELALLTDAVNADELFSVDRDLPVLVDFWAAWCQPCFAMAPDLEAVARSFEGRLRVGKLNVEEYQELAARFNVTALPTLLLCSGTARWPSSAWASSRATRSRSS